MQLRRSQFVHLAPVGDGRTLVIHAVNDLRLVVDGDLKAILEFFCEPRTLPDDYPALAARASGEPEVIVGALQSLAERGVLTQLTPVEEMAALSAALAPTYGRDPAALLDENRRRHREGGEPYWASGPARGLADLAAGKRVDLLLLGDCDVQMEAEFIRAEGAARGLDLRIAASFPDDVRLVEDRPHDAVLIGALRSRHAVALAPPGGDPPFAAYLGEAERLVQALRLRTSAPILIDNLPEPVVEPLGLAETGAFGHRNRFRLLNVALSELAQTQADVIVVDVAAALGAEGARRLLDDGQVGFTHFGSPGWLLQRPATERAAVFDLFPDLGALSADLDGDPYIREKVMARAHVDALVTTLAVDQKKCVIVDLDGVLWPGVLAETGAPFAWSPEVSGGFSFIGHYFGLHEALKCLKRRGVLLACVSKNDEAVVRRLWTYEDHYPKDRLLTPDDFVTWRVNWTDKVDNIQSIADELGFAPEAFLFLDDNPVERDRVRARLPKVETWGEDLLGLRARLLADPRLQRGKITSEAGARTELVRQDLARKTALKTAVSEADHRASLKIETWFRRAAAPEELARISELFERTTQFNATGLRFTRGELERLASGAGRVFALNVKDRFGDHGLVGAVVVAEGEILGLALSCRVLGLGVEASFLDAVLADLALDHEQVRARITPTDRNLPVRNIYRDAGFTLDAEGVWRRTLRTPLPVA